ncbi:hypothetical protein L227DRAFT_580932 [Lentinus tigrinus ALCF2SS1-6]|uniref:Uncharacterized protein n=1 Tax=Lentinus tigrinus ALCF2SS1-6 TaxID=1328759 RepID=A0A5C2RTQ8_9APHY|nr:hypothetical protein L227DRAFT_580932 [Lentinus tigrinus ALCF2SS1-6]
MTHSRPAPSTLAHCGSPLCPPTHVLCSLHFRPLLCALASPAFPLLDGRANLDDEVSLCHAR